MHFNTRNAYDYYWQPGMNYEFLKKCLGVEHENVVRILTFSVQKERICLIIDKSGEPKFIPYTRSEGAWRQVPARDLKVEDVTSGMLESEESLMEAMQRQMLIQFRDSVCGYYYDQPTYREILQALITNPTKNGIEAQRYIYYEVENENDPDWDGVYEVVCDKGVVLIPYVTRELGEDIDPRLLLEHGTFVADSGIAHFVDGLSEVFGRMFDIARNMHWSSIRQKLNGVWR